MSDPAFIQKAVSQAFEKFPPAARRDEPSALRRRLNRARANRRDVLARDAHHGDCPGLDRSK